MAFDLGSIVARIKADTTDFKKGVDEAKSKASSFSSGLNSAVGASTKFAAGLAVVGTAMVAMTGFAVKSAMGIENTRAAFTTMLKDGDKAGALMKELNTFAASTPFEFPELADAGKKLLAFGFSAQEIQPNLRRLGDVASGLGIPIGELSELYGKARVQGRLYMEDINQLTGRGIPIIGELAKQFKVSEGEVRGLVEQGKIGFPELQKGIENMTNAGGMFAGGMERQSKTVSGLISTLKDNVGAFARELVGMGSDGSIVEGSVFARVSQGINTLVTFLDKNKDKIKNGLKTVFGFIADNAPIVVGVILGALIPALWAMASTIVAATGVSFAALVPFIAIGAAIGAAFMLLKPHFGTISEFIKAKVIPAFKSLWDGLKGLYDQALPLLKKAWEFLKPSFEALGNTITSQILPAVGRLLKGLKDFWNFISPVLVPILKVLAVILGGLIVGAIWLVVNAINVIVNVITWLINIFGSLLSSAQTVWNAIWAVVSFVINAIIWYFQTWWLIVSTIFNAIWLLAQAIWNGIMIVVQTVINVILAIIQGLWFAIQGIWNGILWLAQTIWNGIMAVVNFVINAIMAYIQLWWAGIQFIFNAILAIATAVWNAIVAAISWAINTAKNIINGIISVVSSVVGSIKSFFEGAANRVRDVFQSAINTVKSIFNGIKDAVKGVVDNVLQVVERVRDGLVAPFRAAIDKIKGLVNGAKDVLNKLNPFSRNSPSLVDWIKKGTGVIVDQYGRMSTAIANGATMARLETVGTARSLANVSPAQFSAQSGSGGGNGGQAKNITINVEGVLADSPEAKRRFGDELIQLVNDDRNAKGEATL